MIAHYFRSSEMSCFLLEYLIVSCDGRAEYYPCTYDTSNLRNRASELGN